ncbi:MAG TPA: long-chain fatty acid--CoA ligase [Syntrophomonadaceae bacterium]|nr:long-chain fatty acid--CoA ligase [Syntrophomonadaceae bacterium]
MFKRPWHDFYDTQNPLTYTYPRIPLKELFRRNVMDFPEKPYLIVGDIELSYSTVNNLANSLANYLLSIGIKKGDRVALMMPNIPQYVITFQACMKAGFILVATNFMYTKPELEYIFKDSQAKVVLVLAMFAPNVIDLHKSGIYNFDKIIVAQVPDAPVKIEESEDIVDFNEVILGLSDFSEPNIEVLPEDIAMLQYTGGTTGVAKGCCLSNANMVAMGLQTTTCLSAGCPINDIKVFAAIPLYHIYGQNTNINVCLFSGGSMILVPNPADILGLLEAIKQHQPTIWSAVPAMIIAINNHPETPKYDIGSIKVIISGSSAIAVDAIKKFEEISGAVVIEGYGLSESSCVLTVNPIYKRKIGTVGVPMADVDIKIVDLEEGTQEMPIGEPGELIARAPQIMSEYWRNEEETKIAMRDGWLYTGDIATMDEDGYITIVDRKKDMIICSGFNVYPQDIDEVLYSHPKVLDACAIGIPDEKRGESPKAYVVLKNGENATEEELRNFCRRRLTAYKVPRYIEFIDELPRTHVGKPDRKGLRAIALGQNS